VTMTLDFSFFETSINHAVLLLLKWVERI